MTFASQNKAENTTIEQAMKDLQSFISLGFQLGPIHLNQTDSGSSVANMWPLDEVPEEFKTGKVNCQTYGNGNWHNMALLKLMVTSGGTAKRGFDQAYAAVYPGKSPDLAAVNLSNVGKAIERAIQAAFK